MKRIDSIAESRRIQVGTLMLIFGKHRADSRLSTQCELPV
jgi:hypothetical protein